MSDEQRILDAIQSPADLHALSCEELALLAQEIREQIINTTSKTGGHVASSLGAVEIILAVHSMINCPTDKFVFDVGHQAYAHKLVTGRLEQFDTLRTFGGLSGFPKPNESPYDVHPSGHASDSLSIAVGLAKARQLSGGSEKIVTLIGDASISGGMAFEALNYIGQAQLPMIIILNDNEMSISHGVGALTKHLGYIRASNVYRGTRDKMQAHMERTSMGNRLVEFGRNAKDSIKQMIIPKSIIFEQLNILCTPPIDGHNIPLLRETLSKVLDTNGPVLVHCVTKKGAGYGPAEMDPERFHGVGPFDIATGASTKKSSTPSFTDVFGNALLREATADPRIVGITAGMPGGTGLSVLGREFPNRFIDVGISEEHAVGMAAGLATGGKIPVVAIYSTFLQRAYDQIVVDNALSKLHVVFAIDRGGLVGEDGPTHHGVFDMVYMRSVPNMKVMAPSNEAELVNALHTALVLDGPVSLRYPRGAGLGVPVPDEPQVWEVGKSVCIYETPEECGEDSSRVSGEDSPCTSGEGSPCTSGEDSLCTVGEESLRVSGKDSPRTFDVDMMVFGCMTQPAREAATLLEDQGFTVRINDMRWVKPVDVECIDRARGSRLVVTIENGALMGGAGSAVLEAMDDNGWQMPVLRLGIPDAFVAQGKPAELLESLGLDGKGIAQSIADRLNAGAGNVAGK